MRNPIRGILSSAGRLAPAAFLLAASCGAGRPDPVAVAPAVAEPPTAERPAHPDGLAADPPPHTLSAAGSWARRDERGVTLFVSPEGDVFVRFLVLEQADLAEAVSAAWRIASPAMDLRERQRVTGAGSERFDGQLVVTYVDDAGEHLAQAVALGRGPHAFVFLVEGPVGSVDRRGAEIARILQSLDIAGAPRTELVADEARPFDEGRRRQLLEFVERAREVTGVPGVALAVVAGDETLTGAFGTRAVGRDEPVDTGTQFMIGSITKSFSTLLLATLVDEGLLAWETPVRRVYPSFSLSDPERSEAIRVEHLFCACVGAARRDMELLFNFARVRPADVFAQVAGMQLTTGFGETFQYNNQLTAAGGFIAGHLAHPRLKDLGAAYRRAITDRVLGPLRMKDTTIDHDHVVRRRRHAFPHQLDWSGTSRRVDLALERFVDPYAPAGALWSTADDMAKYLRMQLAGGALPGGGRLVSEENLRRTQTPQVEAGERSGYGMGWIIGRTKGLASIEHSGGTMGFSSNLVFFPELGVGLFTAVNRSSSGGLHGAVEERLLELLFDLEPRAEAALVHAAAERERLLAEQRAKVADAPVPEDLLGRYVDEALGGIELRREAGGTVLDAGEWKAGVAVLDPGEAADTLIITGAPLQGLTLRHERRDERTVLVLRFGQNEYVFSPR